MQTITLINNISSHFSLITYPDGQHNIHLDIGPGTSNSLNFKEPITIKCRIKTFSELEVLLCLVSALDSHDFRIKEIQFIYLFGQRSDRMFQYGECNYWRSVMVPILKQISSFSQKCSIMVPHSSYGLTRLKKFSYASFMRGYYCNFTDRILIFGDKSATWHAHNFWPLIDVYNFDKIRFDSRMEISLDPSMMEKIKSHDSDMPIVIFDDLCDGGATFLEEAKFLKEHFPNKKLELFVAHGIFSKGFDELFKYFDKIITTNSYHDWTPHDRLEVIQVI